MSAKQAYGKPPVHLPEVPVEIWCNILRYATATPDSLEHPQLAWDASRAKLKFTTYVVKRYRGSLVSGQAISMNILMELITKVTKRYIVRVCRQWYAIAIPFLYEHVMVFKPHGLQALLDAFGSKTTLIETLVGLRKLGDLVKRIDIHLARDFPQNRITTLLQLCRSTPNLLVLITPPLFGLDSLFSEETVIPHLRYLHAIAAELGGEVRTNMPLKFLASHRSLRLYTPPWFEGPTDEAPNDIWASIQELVFPCFPPIPGFSFVKSFITPKFPAGAFPNLHTVVFLRTETPLIFDSFLAAHGRYLRTIHVRANLPNPCFSKGLFETLKKCCPVLQEIFYSAIPAALIVDDHYRPDSIPGITTAGFQPTVHQLSKLERRQFLENIAYWTPIFFPNARTIRILSEAIILHFQRCHTKAFNQFLESCSSQGIRVEDNFREPLNIPRLVKDKAMDTDLTNQGTVSAETQ